VTTTFRARITDDWLPMPEAVLTQLGWSEGTQLEVEVVGDALVVTRAPDQAVGSKPAARVVRAIGLGAMPKLG
jgi:hypothetical protein